eukprot:7082950-Heterocapsa_arctica.AAC.1
MPMLNAEWRWAGRKDLQVNDLIICAGAGLGGRSCTRHAQHPHSVPGRLAVPHELGGLHDVP